MTVKLVVLLHIKLHIKIVLTQCNILNIKFCQLIFKHFFYVSERIPGYDQNSIAKLTTVYLQNDSNDSVVYFVVNSVKQCHSLVPPGTKGWSPKRSSSPSSDNSERLSPICNYSIYSDIDDFYYPTIICQTVRIAYRPRRNYAAKVARLCIYLRYNKKGRIMAVT